MLYPRKSKLFYGCRSVSQSVCLGIEYPCGTCDQVLLPVRVLMSEICGLISVSRPLWRKDESAICSVITQWPESRRTCNHTLLSHLRLPQPGGPGSRIYIPPGTGWPSYTTGHWVPFTSSLTTRLWRLAGLTFPNLEGQVPVYIYIYIYIPQEQGGQVQSQSHVMTNGQLISMFWSLVYAAIEVLHPNEFQSDIRRVYPRTLGRINKSSGSNRNHRV
jgi:hypothetical protein